MPATSILTHADRQRQRAHDRLQLAAQHAYPLLSRADRDRLDQLLAAVSYGHVAYHDAHAIIAGLQRDHDRSAA